MVQHTMTQQMTLPTDKLSGVRIQRKPGQRATIGSDVTITRRADGWRMRLGSVEVFLSGGTGLNGVIVVDAPRSVPVSHPSAITK